MEPRQISNNNNNNFDSILYLYNNNNNNLTPAMNFKIHTLHVALKETVSRLAASLMDTDLRRNAELAVVQEKAVRVTDVAQIGLGNEFVQPEPYASVTKLR
jgi:hypothetical protein